MNTVSYEEIQARIVELQNDDYASKEAAELQAGLGELVLGDYLADGGEVEVLIGEVVDPFDFVTGFNLWLDE
jgi:hypothetical protein